MPRPTGCERGTLVATSKTTCLERAFGEIDRYSQSHENLIVRQDFRIRIKMMYDTRVIPIILRPVDWAASPFGNLQALPRDAKPITVWSNRDSAFADVVSGLQRVIDELAAKAMGSLSVEVLAGEIWPSLDLRTA